MDALSFSRSACLRLALVGVSAFESIREGFPCFSQGPQFVKEDTENRVIPEDISVVVRVPTDSHRRRSRSLLERNARELDNIIILREFIKHLRHLRIALYDVR